VGVDDDARPREFGDQGVTIGPILQMNERQTGEVDGRAVRHGTQGVQGGDVDVGEGDVRGLVKVRRDAHRMVGVGCDAQMQGQQQRGATVKPRIHDLRHSFALHCLLNWYRNRDDVDG
jgi:hypothetical protein